MKLTPSMSLKYTASFARYLSLGQIKTSSEEKKGVKDIFYFIFAKCSKHFNLFMRKGSVQKGMHFKLLQVICERISAGKTCLNLTNSSVSVYLKS